MLKREFGSGGSYIPRCCGAQTDPFRLIIPRYSDIAIGMERLIVRVELQLNALLDLEPLIQLVYHVWFFRLLGLLLWSLAW